MSNRIIQSIEQLHEFLDTVSEQKYDWTSRKGSALIERLEEEIMKEIIKNMLLHENTELPKIPEGVIDLILKYL